MQATAAAKTRVLVGDVRCSIGQDYVVLRTERGRPGEARTMVTVGFSYECGTCFAQAALRYDTVAAWPKKGRMRVSARDGGGYYIAPWKGVSAALHSTR